VERLGDDFFELRTRIAGEIVHKFAMYGACGEQIVRRFVAESNRGRDL
jgi:hypothetical protein